MYLSWTSIKLFDLINWLININYKTNVPLNPLLVVNQKLGTLFFFS